MAAKGKSTKQKTAGTKTTKARTAGRAAKKATGTRITAKSMAADIVRRDNRRPGFWDSLQREVHAAWVAEGKGPPTRVAQVMPRTNAPEPMH